MAALRDLHADTGLVPVLLDPEDNQADFFFTGGTDPGDIDSLSAAEVLAAGFWGDDEEDDPVARPPAKSPIRTRRGHPASRGHARGGLGRSRWRTSDYSRRHGPPTYRQRSAGLPSAISRTIPTGCGSARCCAPLKTVSVRGW